MRGRRARRKKKRTLKLFRNWNGLVWFLAIVNILVGMAYSPITAPYKVYLSGSFSDDETFVAKIFEQYRAKPWIWINRNEVASQLNAPSNIASVQVSLNMFGRASVHLTHRIPQASVRTQPGVYIDEEGFFFKDAPGFPCVELIGSGASLSGTVIDGFPGEALANGIQLVQKALPKSQFTVSLEGKSIFSIYLKDGPRIEFGRLTDMEKKVDVLKRIVQERPKDFASSTYVQLSDPTRPAFGM